MDFPAAVSAVSTRKRLSEAFRFSQISSRYGVIGKLSIFGVYGIEKYFSFFAEKNKCKKNRRNNFPR